MSEEKWKEASRFYHEYGTVESLGERAKHYMPALWLTQSTKAICAPAVAYWLKLTEQAEISHSQYGIHDPI